MIRKFALFIAAASLAVSVAPAGAAEVQTAIAAGPGGFSTGYVTPVMVAEVGGTLTFVNGDTAFHDVDSIQTLPNGDPVFESDLIGIARTTPVRGLGNMVAGTIYDFYCSIHANMRGKLIAVEKV